MSGPDPADEVARCPDCDAEVAPPGRFCVQCGASVADPGDATSGAAGTAGGSDAAAATTAHPEVTGILPLPASGRGATRRCTSCGQVNARSRELCRACGLDLDPSDRTAVPVRPARRAVEPVPLRARLRRWWVVPLAVVAVAATITGALWWAQLGPFSTSEGPLAVVPFPAERYGAPSMRLELADIGTLTSAPPEGDRIFTPAQMVDDDPSTAWRGEAPALPDGAQETIDVALAEPAWVDAMVVANGDHLDATAYEASGRVQRLAMWFDGDLHVEVTLLDLGRSRQVVQLPEPVLTSAVRLAIVQTLAGVERPEPAIAGLELWGHLADEADAAVARDRAELRPAIGVLVTERQPDALTWRRPGQGS